MLFAGLLVGALALGMPFLPEPGVPTLEQAQGPPEARMANASGLQNTYQTWKAAHEQSGGDRNFLISLGWSRGLSSEYSPARGLVRFDLGQGSARVEIDGLAAGGWDVWVVDNQDGPGRSAIPETGDLMHRLGRMTRDDQRDVLTASLDPRLFRGLQVDVVAVTRAGVRPEEGIVLFGSPILFQRLYAQEKRQPQQIALVRSNALLGFGPRLAYADTPFNSLDPLVAQGANLFFNEKFAGNGRVCATCHPAENNFTIDPKFIATLPASNALFVAETNPALASNFEKPKLLRELGLVLENVDGFDDLNNKFVLRGVPHLLGLSRYLVPGNQSVPPLQRTGWGGDGAPGSGTLREFATGAVVQHFTKALTRTAGTDFRLPTDAELDALEAFQLALGRQDNPVIATIQLKNPLANKGRTQHDAITARCLVCHMNAGANTPPGAGGKNNNFDIGVGRLPNHPADLIDPGNLKPDGGFGTQPVNDAITGEFLGYGLAGEVRFNSQPAIEAVDTAPFFHNNAVQTIEEAVGFYNSQAFKKSQAGTIFAAQGFPIAMETTDVEHIAAFLRVMNALENIRASTELDQGAIDESNGATARRLADLASYDTEDAFQVLEERTLHLPAVAKLKLAFVKEKLASVSHSAHLRDALLEAAIQLKQQARAEMIVE
jgi:cytochrome c peroxidase